MEMPGFAILIPNINKHFQTDTVELVSAPHTDGEDLAYASNYLACHEKSFRVAGVADP